MMNSEKRVPGTSDLCKERSLASLNRWKCARPHFEVCWPWPALQRAFGRRRPDPLPPRVQDGARRHRVEAQGLALSLGALASLAQDAEPGGFGGEAGSGGGLGALTAPVGAFSAASDKTS